ncbi:MAG: putative DNA binding domain-containing protein [Bryobacteraceae bacterium]|nr:putative DNA binding domain-containing protein [Bryobacteraceae bacterium]
MIQEDELRRLLAEGESDRIERTASTRDTDKFSEAVTAFANDLPDHRLPGYLVIGVNDDGTPSGLTVTDQFLQSLGGLRSDGNIQPLPTLNVGKFILPDGEVAVVEVMPSDLPPVRYKGRTFIRVGPRKGVATQQEERILTEKRIAQARTFDALPCVGSSLGDLAEDLFLNTYLSQAVAPEVIAENNRDLASQLGSLRFFDVSRQCPTHAGILLFGKNPLQWLPGAYIQFLRLDGEALTSDVRQEKCLSGDLLTVLRELESLIDLHLEARPAPQSTLRERQAANYPRVALRELLMNAVLHRSYESNTPIRFYWFSDRVEIQSPGGLYGEASPENFPNQNSYRNPVLAEAMKALGFVNKFGRGVLRAQEALRMNGSEPAKFVFDAHYVLAQIRALR